EIAAGRQPALLRFLADPVPLPRPRARDSGHAFHAAEGGGRSHGRIAGQQDVRALERDAATGLRGRATAARARRRVPPAAESGIGGGAIDPPLVIATAGT